MSVEPARVHQAVTLLSQYFEVTPAEVRKRLGSQGPVLISGTEVASRLNVHPNTVRNWNKSGLLPHYQVGPYRKYNVDDVEALMPFRQIGPTIEDLLRAANQIHEEEQHS